MIEAAIELLETTDLPTWVDDAPLRRELERLREDVRAYQIAAGYDMAKASRKAAQVNERADRIRAFMRGHRHSTLERRYWADMRTPA
ncbi:hypothetical protein [Modicisalibacter sp. 'Wilcox']|uniref:hypothetical protein n=1 Tax=Modicisalibacter sp. 'Wilcox' TaxID=2679914 RepID=UPI0013D17A4F|nr:hypothetical protein [Modicisalibacter sp. 'Wilcox']